MFVMERQVASTIAARRRFCDVFDGLDNEEWNASLDKFKVETRKLREMWTQRSWFDWTLNAHARTVLVECERMIEYADASGYIRNKG